MSSYGYHPTVYGGMEDLELYAQFRQERWSELEEASRQQLLQEVVNRAARENGEKGSCLVAFSDLGPGVAGEQGGGVIYLNRDMYVRDQRAVMYKGKLYVRPYPSSNLGALNTALHEDQHAYQAQLLDGTIQSGDPALVREYAANDFTPVALPQPDGSVKLGSTYLLGETELTGRYLYYFQSTERDAHRTAEQKTVAVMEALEAKYGTEESFQEYRLELAANGYETMLAEAQQLFANPAAEREINQSLMNHCYNEQKPVDPRIETVMQAEMEASYAVQNRLELTGKISETAENRVTGPELEETAENRVTGPELEETAENRVTGPELEETAMETGKIGLFDIVIETRSPARTIERPQVTEKAAERMSGKPALAEENGIEDEGGIE